MMVRTHLAITLLAVFLFFQHVSSKIAFVIMIFLASLLPDIDTGFSTLGKTEVGKLAQFFVKHRGFLHSFTFCLAVSILLAFFIPVLSFGFFLGYSLHLFADSFTIEGIKPYWPFKHKISWKIRTGGYTETSVFIVLLLLNIFVLLFFVLGWI